MYKITQVRRIINAAKEQFILLFTQQRPHIIPLDLWSSFVRKDPKDLINRHVRIDYTEGVCSSITIIN